MFSHKILARKGLIKNEIAISIAKPINACLLTSPWTDHSGRSKFAFTVKSVI